MCPSFITADRQPYICGTTLSKLLSARTIYNKINKKPFLLSCVCIIRGFFICVLYKNESLLRLEKNVNHYFVFEANILILCLTFGTTMTMLSFDFPESFNLFFTKINFLNFFDSFIFFTLFVFIQTQNFNLIKICFSIFKIIKTN